MRLGHHEAGLRQIMSRTWPVCERAAEDARRELNEERRVGGVWCRQATSPAGKTRQRGGYHQILPAVDESARGLSGKLTGNKKTP
ncbi:hypothetical protein Bxe_A0854 [Paraburkholderia xenovorans LB400]|uniref:Uncharacterized protein n=1 Tax=Paraburkholderia xenovorans (strain LB400) TaxID=266265 RepID=Q13V09_PARXL|nr:hypothetical protein Bxe_A0854 [Paraburkholderia xenovorans LB400]